MDSRIGIRPHVSVLGVRRHYVRIGCGRIDCERKIVSDRAPIIEDAEKHPWQLGCQTCQRRAEEKLKEAEAALKKINGIANSMARVSWMNTVDSTTVHSWARMIYAAMPELEPESLSDTEPIMHSEETKDGWFMRLMNRLIGQP